MFSKCLANELIRENIRVNAVNPGLILTPDWKKTAGVLTKVTGTSVEQYLDKIARDNVLRTLQLLRLVQVLRRRRVAEDRRIGVRQVADAPPDGLQIGVLDDDIHIRHACCQVLEQQSVIHQPLAERD
jgi:NAD(P)-dependent dehydrogenase (short-subunit alcohol dehydrogenase family)